MNNAELSKHTCLWCNYLNSASWRQFPLLAASPAQRSQKQQNLERTVQERRAAYGCFAGHFRLARRSSRGSWGVVLVGRKLPVYHFALNKIKRLYANVLYVIVWNIPVKEVSSLMQTFWKWSGNTIMDSRRWMDDLRNSTFETFSGSFRSLSGKIISRADT